ncbi:MAG TPA: hypothetical protein VJQ57_03860 [Acidimicrobiia bacterium]|nr:hypothetical protein [Acidimicrobiia bacterium]
MTRPAASVLLELRQRVIEVTVAGGRIRLRAPAGQKVSRTLQQAVAANKADIMGVVTTAPWLLDAPLSVFAQCKVAVEVHAPGLPETIWFASDADQVDRLVEQGVRRGRIWDSGELTKLWAAGPPSHDEILAIAKGKLWSNGVLTDVEMQPAPPATQGAEPVQGTLNLGVTRPPEVD